MDSILATVLVKGDLFECNYSHRFGKVSARVCLAAACRYPVSSNCDFHCVRIVHLGHSALCFGTLTGFISGYLADTVFAATLWCNI